MFIHQTAEKLEIMEEDVNHGVDNLRTNPPKTLSPAYNEIFMCDFKQGYVKYCGLTAVLPALSKRSEFWTKVAPTIVKLNNNFKYMFSMYHQGKPIEIIVDDALPFDKEHSLC